MQSRFLSTAIGSMPFADPAKAVQVSLERLDIPIWPQCSSQGLLEQMEIQYSEGLPCAVIDAQKGRMFFQTDEDYSEAFATFYEAYLTAMDPDDGDGDCSSMAISEKYSKGIYELERQLQAKGTKLPYVKVQTTGPCSISLTLTDENKRAIYYQEDFRDVITKAMAMKSRWQIQKFQPYCDKVVCFIDEPILSAFGSSTYVSVQRDDVVNMLVECIDAVHQDDAIAGIHCCGNTEWSILVDAGVDIVNFDAFDFGETVAMYPEHMKRHLERGGMLAWGVVPTNPIIREQTVDSLEDQLEYVMDHLAKTCGIDKDLIVNQAILSPACGTGSIPEDDAEKVFKLLQELTMRMKSKYGF
ncbi:MAG: hypothetical protein FWF30_00200 [Coriobacteriia bacterium]|nr:hypothetical protein [Coriobacteriia bacterium]